MLTKGIAIILMSLILGGLACAVSFAAVDDNSPVTLDLKDVEVKSAIDALFRGRPGKNFSISQDVSGIIPSLSISNVPFDSALKSLLKTAGLVYRIENSVYMISKKPDANPYAATADPGLVASTPGADAAIDTTTTVESIIDKVPLNNMGATEMLGIMSGNSNQYGGSGGMGGMGMGGMMGGMGGMGMGGMSGGMGGMGGMRGGMSGGYGGMSGGGYGGMSGGYGGGSRSSGGYGGGSSYGGGSRGW